MGWRWRRRWLSSVIDGASGSGGCTTAGNPLRLATAARASSANGWGDVTIAARFRRLSGSFSLVAKELGEDEDWLYDVANEMEVEDGVIWVYGADDAQEMAFTDFGIESLIDLIKMHKDDPTILARRST